MITFVENLQNLFLYIKMLNNSIIIDLKNTMFQKPILKILVLVKLKIF
jgi:hypothetical protein